MKNINLKKKNQIYMIFVFLIFFSFFYISYCHEFNLITQDYQKNPSRIELELTQNPVNNIFLTQNEVSTCLNQIENNLQNLKPNFIQIGDNIHWYPHFSWNISDEANFSTGYRFHHNFQFVFFPHDQFFQNKSNKILNGIELVEGSSPSNSNDIVVDLQFKHQGFHLGDKISFAYYMDNNFTIMELIQDRLGNTPLNNSKFLGNYNFTISGFYQITDDKDLKSLVEYQPSVYTILNNSIGGYSNEYRNYYHYIFSTNNIACSILKNNLSKIDIKDQFDIPFIQKIIFTHPNNNEKLNFQQLSDNIRTIQNWITNSHDAIFKFNEKKITDLNGKLGLFWKNIQNLKNLQIDTLMFSLPIFISLSIIIFLIEKDSIKSVYSQYKKRYLLGEKPNDFIKEFLISKSKIIILQTGLILLLNIFLQTVVIYKKLLIESITLNLTIYFVIISILPILIDILLLKSKFVKSRKINEQFDLHFNKESVEIKTKLKKTRENIVFGFLIVLSLIPIILILLRSLWIDFQSPKINLTISKILITSFLLIFIIPIPISKILFSGISLFLEKLKVRIKKTELSLRKLLILPQMPKFIQHNIGAFLLSFILINILLSGFYLNFDQNQFYERELLKWDSASIKLELRYSDDFNYDNFIESNLLSISGIKSGYFSKLALYVRTPDYIGCSGVSLSSSIFNPYSYSQFIDYTQKIQISGITPRDLAQTNKTYNNSIFISRAFADKLKLNIGDSLRLHCQTEPLKSFKIAGIIERAPLCDIDVKPSNVHIIFPNNVDKDYKQYVDTIQIFLKTEPNFDFHEFSIKFLNHFKQLVEDFEIKNSDDNSEKFNSQFLPRLFANESFLIGISMIICSIFVIRNFYNEQYENIHILKFLGCSKKETKRIVMLKLALYLGIILFVSILGFLLLSFLFYRILIFKEWVQIDSSFYKSWGQITLNIGNSTNWDLDGNYGKSIMIFYNVPAISIIQLLFCCLFLVIIAQIIYSVKNVKENAKTNIIKS
ncbi:MAG: hypothetical protein ACTSWL_03765 [Promethearchaeota archaeon]